MPAENVVIVGAGVSGLSAAYFLSRSGIRSTLIEKADRLGGLIKTDLVGGCELEAGPDSYLAAKPAVTELAQELPALKDQIIGSNDASRRIFVVRGGKLMPMPPGMVMMVPTRWGTCLGSPLFNLKTKLGFFAEMLRKPIERRDDISVEQFVTDHLGKEVLRYVAEPLLSGVYGGDSARMSTESVLPRFLAYERTYGSLIRGARREHRGASRQSIFLSFRSGMQTLTDSLAQAAANHTQILHAQATRVERSAGGWRVHVGQDRIQTKHVILACPAYVAAELIEGPVPSLASELAAVRYTSAILVNLVYERSSLKHALNGFGFLVPRHERRSIAAVTYVSTKFPNRVPAALAAVRAFFVDPEAGSFLSASNDTLIDLVRSELRRLSRIDAAPLFWNVQRWPNSMPQYEVGHPQRCKKISGLLESCRELYLIGNAYQGVGIPDCVCVAKETAKRITAQSST